MLYFSNGGFNWGDLYSMPIKLREFYWRELLKAKEGENEIIEKAKSNSNNFSKTKRR
jgi:hypothetical protein